MLSGNVHPHPGPNHDLTICHTNIRSLKAEDRLTHIRCDLALHNDIITVSETWLTINDHDDLFKLQGFQAPFRRDRLEGAQGYGGVLAWVNDSIACKRRLDFESPDIESMWLEIRSNNNKFFLCVLYRAESNTDYSFWEILQDQIDLVLQEEKPKIIVTGDLNADPATRHGILLKQFAYVNNMTVLVDQPTRITLNKSSILDQFITNVPHYAKDIKVLPPVSLNDHCTIVMECQFRVKTGRAHKRIMWNYNESNFDIYRDRLKATNFDECFRAETVDLVCESWTSKLLKVAKDTLVHKLVTVRIKDKPWYNNNLRKLKSVKDRFHKIAKQIKSQDAWVHYREHRNNYFAQVKQAQEIHKNVKYENICNNGNSKNWWKILKEVYKCNDIYESIPPLQNGLEIITDNADKTTLFNDFFIEASTIDDLNATLPDTHRIINDGSDLESIIVTEQDVKDQISLLDVSKSYGPDGVSPRIIKEGAEVLAKVLTRLFNLSLSKMKVPRIWKQANVVPIHKKDLKTVISNYRPISLLSCAGKLFEKVFFKYVFNHLHDNFVLSTHQSGFLPGKSTVTQLTEVYHLFCSSIDKNKEIRVVFLDISKAFDRVWHRGLIHKLQKAGINGNILNWFIDYLKDRQQRVVINGQYSSWKNVKAGVPQGSVLGPLLFLIHINDISNVVQHCKIRLFADDTCLFIEVDNREETAIKINQDLQHLHNWSKQWLITFSEIKTKSLLISNKIDANKNPPVMMNNTIIEEVPSFTYLGLTFTKNLRWNNHIDKVTTKARKRLSAMMPLKFKLDRRSLETMFKSFVLPILEYGLIVWGGTYDTDIIKLERIHLDAMRLITGATARSSIAALYEETSFVSFRDRIDRLSLTMLFKIKNDLSPEYLKILLPDENHETIHYNLRNKENIKIPFTRLETFKRSFIPRAIRIWNALSIPIRNCKSLATFKLALKADDITCNILYYYGERWASVHHARIRMCCSKLNSDLFYKLHVVDNPSCSCGYHTENSYHYFFICRNYNESRTKLLTNISNINNNIALISLGLLLNGSSKLSYEENASVFTFVHMFIKESGRFES